MIAWVALAAVAQEPAETVLDDPAFEFCHVPRQFDDREAWCEFVRALPPDRCPGVHEACARMEAGEPVDRTDSGCDERDEETAETSTAPAAPRQPLLEWSDDATNELLQWVGAFAVAALVLILLRLILSTFGAWRIAKPKRDPASSEPPPIEEDSVDDALPDVPALTSGALIDRAQEAFAAGRFGEAAWLARGATLKHLHLRSLVRLHRSKTDREYLRSVRTHPEVEGDLRTVVAAAERHRWGAEPVVSDEANDALAAARRLLAVAAALLVCMLALPSAALAQADRFAPDGDAGLARVLSAHGHDAGYRLVSLDALDHNIDALFIDLGSLEFDDRTWTLLRDWVDDGGVLVAAGDVTGGFPSFGEWVTLPPDASMRARSPLNLSDTPLPHWPAGPRAAYTLGQPWVEADVDGATYGVVSEVVYGAGVVVAIADPRLFDNLSFVDPANEAFVGDLLYLGQAHLGWPLPTPARVQLVTQAALARGSESSANNPIQSMANAELLPFVLQLLAMWTLLVLWRGWPMGRPADARDGSRLSFGEHVTALGTRWFREGASGHALREVAKLWLGRLGPSGLHLAARRAGYDESAAKAFVVRVQAAAEVEDPVPSETDFTRMEEIWTITRRTT